MSNLALQTGAHGAFTWGVLNRLLREDRITFQGISAASAGAINAVVFVGGLVEGRGYGAKRAHAKLWRQIAHLGSLTPLRPSLAERLIGSHGLELIETVDSGALRSEHCPVKLFPVGDQCPQRQDQGLTER